MNTTQSISEYLTKRASRAEGHNADGHDIAAGAEARALRWAAEQIEQLDREAAEAAIKAALRKAQDELAWDIDIRSNSGKRNAYRVALGLLEQ